MLEAVELPAGIPHLDARLPYVDADDLPHLLSLFCSALLFCSPRSSELVPARTRGSSQKGTGKGLLEQDRDKKVEEGARPHSDVNRSGKRLKMDYTARTSDGKRPVVGTRSLGWTKDHVSFPPPSIPKSNARSKTL
jgi:hypothetical protein